MTKNYYIILGVASDASDEAIKAAFRRRALELHPDVSGLESGPFREAQEAYGVLSDPERRRRYDEQSRPLSVRCRPWGPSAQPLVMERSGPEPFRAVKPAGRCLDYSLTESFARHAPPFEEILARWWSNFETAERPKAERVESLTVEIVLGPEEARWGGTVRVGLPARATCQACGGHGAVGPYECWRCEGRGALAAEYPVDVDYPPGLRDGYAVRIPLTPFGIKNLFLTVFFRVGSAA